MLPLNEDTAFAHLETCYNGPIDEARRLAISNNLAGFFQILHEWDQTNTEKEHKTDALETKHYQNKRPAS